MRRLLDASVTGDRATMADLVTSDLTAWSPEFDGDRICAFRSYFDDLALVEQLLVDE